jgi:hypothetical protein
MYDVYYAGFIPGVILKGEVETLSASDSLIVYEVPSQLCSFLRPATFDFSPDLDLLLRERENTSGEKNISILAYPSGVSLSLGFIRKKLNSINFLVPSFLIYSSASDKLFLGFNRRDIVPLQYFLED